MTVKEVTIRCKELYQKHRGEINNFRRFADWAHKNVENLTRQNNTLLEEVPKKTEGKAE